MIRDRGGPYPNQQNGIFYHNKITRMAIFFSPLRCDLSVGICLCTDDRLAALPSFEPDRKSR